MSPGQHGVFDFLDRRLRPFSFIRLRGRAVWDIISLAGRKAIIVNVPFTYPPYKLSGLMISGPPCPGNKVFVWPPDELKNIKELEEYYVPDLDVAPDYRGMDEVLFRRRAKNITETRRRLVGELMERQWDLFVAIFTTLDRVQHVYYGFSIKESPLYDVVKREYLVEYYNLMDKILETILSKLDGDTYLFVVSDHGFDYLVKFFGLYNALLSCSHVRSFKARFYELTIGLLIEHSKLFKLAKLMSEFPRGRITISTFNTLDAICLTCSIFLKSKELRSIISRLTTCLPRLTDEGDSRIIDAVYRPQDLYAGSKLGKGPDLIVVPRQGYEPKAILSKLVTPIRPCRGTYKTGAHVSFNARFGFFAALGDDIKSGARIDVDILSVAPTILHILDIPLPSYMHKEPLKGLFKPGSKLAERRTRKMSIKEVLRSRIRAVKGKMAQGS